MKKILIFSPTGGYAGIDVCLDNLVSNIDKSKFKIVVILPNDAFLSKKFEETGIKYYELPLKWWFPIGVSGKDLPFLINEMEENINAIIEIINYENADMVLSNTTVSLDGCIASAVCKRPHAFFMHARFVDNIYVNLLPQTKEMLYRMMGYLSAEVVCCSETLKNQMKEYINNVSYINNGIDTEKFRFEQKMLKTDGVPLKILMAGHFNENKQHEFVLEALKIIKEQEAGLLSQIQYTAIGYSGGEYKGKLIHLVKEYGLEENVIFEEFSDNMPEKLKEYNLYVNSSITETLPLSVMEAMASGLPVVATPTDGSKLIVQDGKTGFICETPQKMADCFRELLKDEALLKEMSRQARIRIEESFSLSSYINNFESFLYKIASMSDQQTDMYTKVSILYDTLTKWPRNTDHKMNILVVYPVAALPSFIIAAKKPLEYLGEIKNISYTYKDLPEVTDLDIQNTDVIFCIRYYHDAVHDLLRRAHYEGKSFVWYIDDNYNALVFENGMVTHKENKNQYYEYMFLNSDYVVVNNEQIYKLGLSFTTNISCLPTYQDITHFDYEKRKPESIIRFGFMGTLNRDNDFDCVAEALEKILEKYEENIEVEFIGYYPSNLTKRENVHHFEFIHDYDEFRKFFESREWDFAIAPLKDTQFNRSKTNNKYREYSSYGIPAIYSNIITYSGCINNYENGILVDNNVNSWFSAIDECIASKDLRERLGRNAYDDIVKNFNIKNYALPLFDIFDKVIRKKEVVEEDCERIGDIRLSFVNNIKRVSYSFVSTCEKLTNIGVIFACYGKSGGRVTIKIYDRNKEIRRSTKKLDSISWNKWTFFSFPVINNAYMKEFKIKILFDYSIDADPVGVFEVANKQSVFTYGRHFLGLRQTERNLLYIKCL